MSRISGYSLLTTPALDDYFVLVDADGVPGSNTRRTRLRDIVDIVGYSVNVKSKGAVGDGVTNDTAAIQSAINAAGPNGIIVFPGGVYQADNLVSTHLGQHFIGQGRAIIRKRANGDLLTCSGDNIYMEHVEFWGDATTPVYTGHNLVLTGNRPTLRDCSSVYAYGRAVKATGNSVRIVGTGNIYATADTTASGYDIEIGQSGVATLYHVIQYISTQSTGGILLTDVGSHMISNSQFGKYTVAAGTSPAGVNGGMISNSRILGAINIGISNSIMALCQFGSSATIDYAAGTSGHEYWASVDSNAAITNLGNGSSAIVRQVNNDGTIGLLFGDDSSLALMQIERSTGKFTFPALQIPNNQSYRLMRAAPNASSQAGRFTATVSDNIQIVADIGALQYSVVTGQLHQFLVNSVEMVRINANGLGISVAAGAQATGVLGLGNGTQTTVGAAGGASALPATPTGYLKFYLGATQYVFPYYAQA